MSIANQALPISEQLHQEGAILEAEHIRKLFPLRQARLFGPARAVHAVEDTSLALYPGRATALVGESGSGKTTVARMLARMYDLTSGTLRFRGKPVDTQRCRLATRISTPCPTRVSRPVCLA